MIVHPSNYCYPKSFFHLVFFSLFIFNLFFCFSSLFCLIFFVSSLKRVCFLINLICECQNGFMNFEGHSSPWGYSHVSFKSSFSPIQKRSMWISPIQWGICIRRGISMRKPYEFPRAIQSFSKQSRPDWWVNALNDWQTAWFFDY